MNSMSCYKGEPNCIKFLKRNFVHQEESQTWNVELYLQAFIYVLQVCSSKQVTQRFHEEYRFIEVPIYSICVRLSLLFYI